MRYSLPSDFALSFTELYFESIHDSKPARSDENPPQRVTIVQAKTSVSSTSLVLPWDLPHITQSFTTPQRVSLGSLKSSNNMQLCCGFIVSGVSEVSSVRIVSQETLWGSWDGSIWGCVTESIVEQLHSITTLIKSKRYLIIYIINT